MAINKIKGAGIAVKGFGKAMKSMMKKAFVKKPTFPGPNATNILNKEIQKKKQVQDLEDKTLLKVLQECVKANLVKVLLKQMQELKEQL